MFKLIAYAGTRAETDAQVVRLAKLFLSRYLRSRSVASSFEEACAGKEMLGRISRMLRMGCSVSDSEIRIFENKNMREFVSIIAFGVESGVNVEKSVELFVRRLTREIEIKNRFDAKIGGMQALTRMGISVFFPLFSGISAIIIKGSAGLLEMNALPLYRGFLAVAVVYVLITLYLSSAFTHPEKRFAANMLSIAPYFLLAVSIICATQTYMTYVV